MAAVATRGAYTQPAYGQLHVVVDYYQLLRLGAEPGHKVRDAFAAVVHERSGLGQHHRLSAAVSLPQYRLGSFV